MKKVGNFEKSWKFDPTLLRRPWVWNVARNEVLLPNFFFSKLGTCRPKNGFKSKFNIYILWILREIANFDGENSIARLRRIGVLAKKMCLKKRALRSCSTRINMDNRRLSFVENIFIGSSIFWNRFGPTNENNAVRVCWHDNTIIQMYKAKQNGRCYLKSKTSNILKD